MKQKIKRLICRILGHVELEEVYAVVSGKGRNGRPRYSIVCQIVCLRCGKTLFQTCHAKNLSRTEMIRRGWFIEDNKQQTTDNRQQTSQRLSLDYRFQTENIKH